MSDILTRVKNHWDETGFHDAVHVTSSSCHCSSKGHNYKGGWDPLPQCHDADFSGFQVYFWTMFCVTFLLPLFWLFSCCNLILTTHKIIVTNQRIKSNLKYKSCFSFFLFNLETLCLFIVFLGGLSTKHLFFLKCSYFSLLLLFLHLSTVGIPPKKTTSFLVWIKFNQSFY